MYDVTSLGSSMLRLSALRGYTIKTTPSFLVSSAGAESNVLAALACLDRNTAWISKLLISPLSKRIVDDIASHRIDVSGVRWVNSNRVELLFTEAGFMPRKTQVIYDRSGAAIETINYKDFDLNFLLNTRFFHFTGILPSLSSDCAITLEHILEEAFKRDVKISCDVNYRRKLWTPEEARLRLTKLIDGIHILFITLNDAKLVFNLAGNPESILKQLKKMFSAQYIAMTLGADGVIGYDGKKLFNFQAYKTEIRDRLGAGDSFAAGVLHGLLENNFEKGLQYGNAMAALKLTVQGDYFTFSKDEVEFILHQTDDTTIIR